MKYSKVAHVIYVVFLFNGICIGAFGLFWMSKYHNSNISVWIMLLSMYLCSMSVLSVGTAYIFKMLERINDKLERLQ